GGNALRSPVLARCFRRARVAAASSEGRSRQLRKRFSAIASSVVRAIVSSIRIPSPPQRGENYPFFWIKSKRLLYRTKAPACHSAPLGAYTGFGCALPPAKSLIYPAPPSIRAATERWPSGRRRSPAKGVDLKMVSWVRIPSSPPLAPAKSFSRSGCGRIFALFSRVMREGLFTAFGREHANSFSCAPYSPDLLTASLRLTGVIG